MTGDQIQESVTNGDLRESTMLEDSDALRELDIVGLREFLDQDSRPTFVIDLDPDLDVAINIEGLSPTFSNTSLRSYERLLDLVCGQALVETLNPPETTPYREFRSWVTSVTKFDDSGDIFPITHFFSDYLWTGSTIRKRWRVISGNHCYQTSSLTSGDLSSGPPSEVAFGPTQDSKLLGNQALKNIPKTPSDNKDESKSATTASFKPQTSKSSDIQETKLTTASSGDISVISLKPVYGGSKRAPDWTVSKPKGSLTDHITLVRSIDWATTPLGPMKSWSPEFRQIANFLMASPHCGAVFWGEAMTMMYNEAYATIVAGRKHPSLMGTGFKGPFSELWSDVAPIMEECARTGISVAKVDQQLPMERQGFLEETFFSWSFTPLYGNGTKILGFYNAPFETTQQVVNSRRTHTLHQLGEEVAGARSVKEFWQKVLHGLTENNFDVPFALLYSVEEVDDGDGESSSHSDSSMSWKSCIFEGGLGIPSGHPAAPTRLDLKRSRDGFIPSFREAMRTREPTKLQTRDGSLPESLVDGIEWRGFPEPCREAVIFPVRPTNGENVLGFLLLGINPRRPYDHDYRSFVNILNRQLATSLASIILFEDEIRRGQTLAEAAAREREKLSDQLAIQTSRLQRMTELSPVGLFYSDSDGLLLEANDRWYDMTGHPKDNFSQNSWLDTIAVSSLTIINESWHQLLSGNAWSSELLLKNPWVDHLTGEVLENWILAAAHAEIDGDGIVRSVMGSFTDITRIKWAEGLQSQRLEEAEQTKQQANNFLDLTSHEMRNPLSAILHCADDISSALADYKSWASTTIVPAEIGSCLEAAETITLCVQHQKSIVDDILTISKLDSDLLLMTPATVQPIAIVQRALKIFDAELQKKDFQIEFSISKSCGALTVDWVVLDPSRLLQVLINLMTNAIKFTQDEAERSIIVRIGASLEPLSEDSDSEFQYVPSKVTRAKSLDDDWGSGELLYLQFEVQDTGRGLTEDEKKLLFLRFSQASPRTHAQYGGSGLGLFISRQLTELHGGQIGVASQAGAGSTFAFYIRARRGKAPSEKKSTESEVSELRQEISMAEVSRIGEDLSAQRISAPLEKPTNPTIDPNELNVLIVEDNLVNQKVLSKQLQKLGCKVSVAGHGGEALDQIEKTEFWKGNEATGRKLSVVLMDLEMPVMDGLTCVRRIRELEHSGQITRRIPIIAVTANVRVEQIATAKESGMDDLVSKPFRIHELMVKVAELLSA